MGSPPIQLDLFSEPATAGTPAQRGEPEPAVWTLRSIAEYYGAEYLPNWRSDMCSIRQMNCVGCDYALCTHKCHGLTRAELEARRG